MSAAIVRAENRARVSKDERRIEKERKRKREDRKISSRMVGRAAIERRPNSREREGKKKRGGERVSFDRWSDTHACNHVLSKIIIITIIREIRKFEEEKCGWEKRFLGCKFGLCRGLRARQETRKPRAVVLPRDRSALLLRRGRSKRKKAVRGRRLCPILARLPG